MLSFVRQSGKRDSSPHYVRSISCELLFTPPNPLEGGTLGSLRGESRFPLQAKPPFSKGGLEGLSM